MTSAWVMLEHWVLSSTVQTGVMVVVLGLVTMLAGRHLAPKWTAALWLLVFLRLVIPWNPVTLVSLPPTGVAPHIASAIPTAPTVVVAGHLAAPPLRASRAAPGPSGEHAPALLGALWLLVIVVLAVRTVWREWAFRRAIQQSARPLHLGSVPQVRMPEVWETSAVDAPAAFGIWRPKILVPLGLRIMLTSDEWQLMLRHELSHIHRRDVLARWGMELVAIVYWFNPFVWIARHYVRQSQELAADDAVLGAMAPGDRPRYGHTLLMVAGLIQRSAESPSTAGMQWPRGSLVERIRRIRRAPRHRLAGLAAATAAVLVGLAAIATSVRAAPAPANRAFLAVEHGLRGALPSLRHQPDISGVRVVGMAQAGGFRIGIAVNGPGMAEAHLATLFNHYLKDARAMAPTDARATFLTRYALTIDVYGSSLNGPVVAWATKSSGAERVRWFVPSQPIYPKNARGQTYGTDAPTEVVTASNAGRAQPVNLNNPELVWVQATNGKTGFAYARQLQGPMPKNPQQAIAMNNLPPRTIPVYAKNGTTVIGDFVVGGATSDPPHVSAVVPTWSLGIGPVSGKSARSSQQQLSFSARLQNVTNHTIYVTDVKVKLAPELQSRVLQGTTRIRVDKRLEPHAVYQVTGRFVLNSRGMTSEQIQRLQPIQGFTANVRP